MCLSIPRKIIKIKNGKAVVSYNKEKRNVKTAIKNIKEGDYVIVNNGIIVGKLKKQEAEQFLKIIKNVGRQDGGI